MTPCTLALNGTSHTTSFSRPHAPARGWLCGLMQVVVAAVACVGVVKQAAATVGSTLTADTYNVVDGDRTYAVLDVYVTGNHLGDAMGASILGAGTHSVTFATSSATGTGLVRDNAGKITAGTITNDVFVQSGGSGWLPTNADGASWDSFIAVGNRGQAAAASVTNRAGTVKNQGLAANMTASSGFSQMNVPNSNFINNGTNCGWYSALGGNAYSTAGAAENPFARVSLYNADWNNAYPTLNRTGLLVTKGKKQSGRTTASGSVVYTGDAGSSLNFCWMVGRFAIDVTDLSPASIPTMQVQFNMVGKNGATVTGNENGTTFTGATTASYKVNQFFSFSAPTIAPPQAPTGLNATDGSSTANVSLTWSASTGATNYNVRRSGAGVPMTQIGSVVAPTLTYTDATALPGVLYTYEVRAVGAGGEGASSTGNTGWRGLTAPTGVAASDGTSASNVTISWTTSSAPSYKVFRGLSAASLAQIGTSTTISYTDTTAVIGTLYTYAVKASGETGTGDSDLSATDTGWRTVAAPASMVATDGTSTDAVTLEWAPVQGASTYKVRRSSGGGTPSLIASPSTNRYVDGSAVPGTLYIYSVTAAVPLGESAAATDTGWRMLTVPATLRASDGTFFTGVRVEWGASTGAVNYDLYRGSSSATSRIATVSGTSYEDTSATPGVSYTYAVKAVGGDGTGTSAFSNSDTGWRSVGPPTSVTAQNGVSRTSVAINWTPALGGTSVKIFRAIGSGVATQIGSTTAASFADSTASPGVLYTYYLKSTSANGDSVQSDSVTGWRGMTPPATVTATAGASTNSVTVTWTAAVNASKYQVLRAVAGGSPAVIGADLTSSARSYTDESAVPGTLYAYTVKSTGGEGTGNSVASVPAAGWRRNTAPTALAATDGTSSAHVVVTWVASPGASGYKLFRSTGTAAAIQLATTTGTSFNDTTAVPGVTYTYSAKASGQTGTGDSELSTSNSGWRGIVVPTEVSATDGSSTDKVVITWTGASSSSYKIFRAAGSGTATQIGTSSTTSFNDTTALPATLYTYSVKTTSPSGDSASSQTDTGWVGLSAPATVTASKGTSSTAVNLSWTAVRGATGYTVYRATGLVAGTQLASITGTSYVDQTAEPGVYYTYTVAANSALGASSTKGDTGWRMLSAPTSVSATDGTDTSRVVITWAAPAGATRYSIYRAEGTATAVLIGSTVAPVVSFTDTSAAAAKLYTYSVSAWGSTGAGESARSVSNPGWRGMVPPAGVSASDGTSTSQVTLSWNATIGAVSYKVYRGATLIGTTSGRAIADVSATPGTVFAYSVIAVGPTGTGQSARSGTDNGWRNLSAPTGLVATKNLATKIQVRWNSVSSATGYSVYRGTSASSMAFLAIAATTTYDDTTAVAGTTYYYAVSTRSGGGDSVRSTSTTGLRVASLLGGNDPKPGDADAGDGAAPSTTAPTEETEEPAPMGVERYLQVVAVTKDAAVACAPFTAEATEVPADASQAEDGTETPSAQPPEEPSFIDLDQNGEADLCQLRRGDLDLDGTINESDLALLLTMLGEAPVMGFGDLNDDGVIDSTDVAELTARQVPAEPATR